MSKNTKAYIMLILATLFWAGNFTIGKFAYTENVPPYSLAFFRWILVWIILLPFTYKEILKIKTEVKNNLIFIFYFRFYQCWYIFSVHL
jgi:drug/metabolite transporter (DMT)-like permease